MMDPDSRCSELCSCIFSFYFFIAVTMKTIANEALKKRVISYFENFTNESKVKAILYFTSEGKQRGTTYNIISRYQATKKTNHTKITGRPATVGTPKTKKQILKTLKKDPTVSVAAAANTLRCNPKTLQNIKAKKLGFKSM